MADLARDRQLMPPPSSPIRRRPSSGSTPLLGSPAMGSHTSSVRSSTSAFSEGAKTAVTGLNGDDCWACGSREVDICHVVAREDRQAAFWSDLGLINFPLSSFLNGIPLCKTCHGQFDCSLDPGLIFVPTNLQFFIDFELKDRQRRKEAADRGEILARQIPNSEQYQDANGALYMPVFLKPYLLSRLRHDVTRDLSVPRSWHGAPMACIRRCIHALSSGRLATIDRQALMKIRQLYDLYFCYDDENLAVSSQRPPDTAQTPGPGNGERKRRSDRDIEPENPHPAKQRGARQGDSGNDYGGDAVTYCPFMRRVVPACWSLGPEVSTEEAVRQFAPIIARRQHG